MSAETSHLEQQQAKESIKNFLAKELNKPELAKKTAEEVEKKPEDIKILKNMLEKNIKPIIEKWEKLDINKPEDIKKAKMLIAYQILDWWDIQWYFPKKVDEQINRASSIMERKVNEANFDKRQWQNIQLDNCTNPDQKNQIISCKAEFTSWNAKFDQLLKSNPLLKKYLDLQATNKNLWRLESMTWEKWVWPEWWKFKQLKQELWAKRETLWREKSSLSKELFSDPTKAMEFVNLLNNLTPNELNSEWFYEVKNIIRSFLEGSQDKTFSYRDLSYDDGVDTDYETWNITINKPHVEVDNMQIVSVWPDGIKLKNTITGQETTLNKNVIQKAKEIREQNDTDWKYIKNKREAIIKKLNINIEENFSREDRVKVEETLIKEAFWIDQKLFEILQRRLIRDGDEKWKPIGREMWSVFNAILKEKWISNIDCTRWRTTIDAKEIGGKKVFVLDQWDTKIIIPFNGQPQVEQHQMSQEKMNEPMKDVEKSSAYIRAEYEIEHPRKRDEVNLSWLWLNSKEITSLLANPKLAQIDNLKINLTDNKITTFPGILISMKNIQRINLDGNFIKELPKDKIDKTKCEKLETISLDNNNISEIPEQFLQLDQIKDLSIANNRLSKIPSFIDKLSKLETLRISHNDIQELPEDITKIKTLKSLSAYECKLENLPKDINKLTNLESLGLEHNKLKEIPDISTLVNLENLDLANNDLTGLPPLWSLVKLETLSIEDNKKLTMIPNDIKTLPKLKSEIKLSNNINSWEEVKDRFIDGYMSKKWYEFPDWANKFFVDNQQYKFTFAQWSSESEALKNAQNDLKITETDQTFVMKKKLVNGNYSFVVFSSANPNEYYKK